MSKDNFWKEIEEIVRKYVDLQRAELKTRWLNWKLDLTKREMFEVVGSLLARQVTLAEELALAPSIWNLNVAPLILRAMIDNHINLAWIFMEPLERSRKFILYGLGEEKLQIEHLKNRITEQGENPEENEVINHRSEWLDSQRFSFLTEVTIGSWSGLGTRKMAEEANCLELYNNEYQSYSSATHNMWNFVGKFNLIVCPNPLHGFHRMPLVYSQNNIYFVLEASEIVEKTFLLFDDKTNNKEESTSAHNFLLESLNKFGLTLKKMREQKE